MTIWSPAYSCGSEWPQPNPPGEGIWWARQSRIHSPLLHPPVAAVFQTKATWEWRMVSLSLLNQRLTWKTSETKRHFLLWIYWKRRKYTFINSQVCYMYNLNNSTNDLWDGIAHFKGETKESFRNFSIQWPKRKNKVKYNRLKYICSQWGRWACPRPVPHFFAPRGTQMLLSRPARAPLSTAWKVFIEKDHSSSYVLWSCNYSILPRLDSI